MSSSSTEQNNYLLSSVQNAMRILQLFKENTKKDMGVSEISRQTGLAKSTTHRLISTLTNEGFLSQNPRTGEYRLGLALLTLGGVISVHKEIYREAFPVMEETVREVKETCHLCLLERDKVVYFYRIEGENPATLVTDIGRKNPIHCTSEGLVLLAYQDNAYVEQILDQDLPRYTPYTITDPSELQKTLREVRTNGYAISKEHYFEHYIGIAVPVRDYSSNVVSSLAMIGPTTRITEDRYPYYIETLKNAARDISEELGYYGDE